MNTYDFDKPVDRRGTGSLKWDVGADELPLWVADMNFRAAPEVVEALCGRVEHGVFDQARGLHSRADGPRRVRGYRLRDGAHFHAF